MAERNQEPQDIQTSNERLDSANEALREELNVLNGEKRALEQTRESLKDAIEDMQNSARSGIDAADKVREGRMELVGMYLGLCTSRGLS